MTADTPNIDKALAHVCANTNGAGVYCARTELSALKARVEAAESAAYAVCREIADEEGRDCGCSKRIMDRIDAALQAAMESTEPKGS